MTLGNYYISNLVNHSEPLKIKLGLKYLKNVVKVEMKGHTKSTVGA